MPNKSLGKSWVQTSDEEVAEALRRNHGFTAATAKDLGVFRNTLLGRIKRNPELRKIQMESRESGSDIAEGLLFELVEAKDFNAIKFYLQNNDPRYSERLNVTMTSLNLNANVDLSKLNEEELAKLYELINKSTTNTDSDTSGDLQEESL